MQVMDLWLSNNFLWPLFFNWTSEWLYHMCVFSGMDVNQKCKHFEDFAQWAYET